MKILRCLLPAILSGFSLHAQSEWQRVDSLFGPLPTSVHVYRTTSPIATKPQSAYYVEAILDDRSLSFTADTTSGRRFTPQQFYDRNGGPLVVVNTSFFSFATHQNLNLVMAEGRLLAYNQHAVAGKGKDTLTWRHALASAIGIDRNRRADVAWTFTDSSRTTPLAIQRPLSGWRDSVSLLTKTRLRSRIKSSKVLTGSLRPWVMHTAVGGGPVLVQSGQRRVTNNEEWKFAGKAIDDRHPRTAMGYTADGRLIILAVEGRNPGRAEGVTLTELADLLVQLGCIEALNLDGGGSSCLLVNGIPTIRVSDKEGQRPVPGVFLIRRN